MKILLTAINSQYIHSNLAVRYLKAYVKDLDVDCCIKEFTINDRKEKILENILIEKPDIIAFSTYIWNGEYVEALSKLIKRVNPNIKIIYGGPEASYDSYSFLNRNDGDFLIEGEGEETFRELTSYLIGDDKDKSFIQKATLGNIKGLYYKLDGEIFYNGLREIMDMNKIVFPYTEDDDLSNKIVYYEASRGCPFRCKYCLSSVSRKLRFLELERVKKELMFLVNKKVKLVKFVDRTFNSKHEFASEIWSFLAQLDTDTKFHFEISADLINDNEIEILSNAPKGRFQFEVGVQTTNNEVLRNVNRRVNFEDIAEKVKEVKKLSNIMQHLDLIAGLPGEDYQSFKKSFNDVYSIRPDEVQLGFLKLIKGSPMRAESEKWGMAYSPYQPYEILKTNDISYEELIKLKKVEAMVNKYYNTGKFNEIIHYFIPKFDTPFDFYYELGMFFQEKGYFDRNITSFEYYRVFLEFNEKILKENNNILFEVVKYNYLEHNKKRGIPAFLCEKVDKKEAKALRNKVKEIELFQNINNFHVEKYSINIIEYLENGNANVKDTYILYDIDNQEIIVDITKYL